MARILEMLRAYWAPTALLGVGLGFFGMWAQMSGFLAGPWLNRALFAMACVFISAAAWAAITKTDAPWWGGPLGAVAASAFVVIVCWRGIVPPVPAPPQIVITNLQGLRPPATADDIERLREYRFTIANNGRRPLYRVRMDVQFPEWSVSVPPPASDWPMGMPDGVSVSPLFSDPAPVQLGGAIEKTEPMDPGDSLAPAFRIEIAELAPDRPIEFFVRCQVGAVFTQRDESGQLLDVPFNICGSYQFERQSDRVGKWFLVPLIYDSRSRGVKTGTVDTSVKNCAGVSTFGAPYKIKLRRETPPSDGSSASRDTPQHP